MVGVAKNDLSAQRLERVLGNGFYSSLRAHRHEYRRFNSLMRQRNTPPSSAGLSLRDDFKTSAHQLILSAIPPLFTCAKPDQKSEASDSWLAESCAGRLGNLNCAVK